MSPECTYSTEVPEINMTRDMSEKNVQHIRLTGIPRETVVGACHD